jgi:hypothetical protein
VSDDGFEATFRLRVDRATAWERLTGEGPSDRHRWLAGFDAQATVQEMDAPNRLRATKDDQPCAGTDIVVTLTDEATGTTIHVVQSGFGDWFPAMRELLSVGWCYIVADRRTFLATGVHARRHLRAWGDLGADASADDGGVRVRSVRPGGLAERLGLADGDLLVTLADAPVTSLAELATILRTLDGSREDGSRDDGSRVPAAEWIRDGALLAGWPTAGSSR